MRPNTIKQALVFLSIFLILSPNPAFCNHYTTCVDCDGPGEHPIDLSRVTLGSPLGGHLAGSTVIVRTDLLSPADAAPDLHLHGDPINPSITVFDPDVPVGTKLTFGPHTSEVPGFPDPHPAAEGFGLIDHSFNPATYNDSPAVPAPTTQDNPTTNAQGQTANTTNVEPPKQSSPPGQAVDFGDIPESVDIIGFFLARMGLIPVEPGMPRVPLDTPNASGGAPGAGSESTPPEPSILKDLPKGQIVDGHWVSEDPKSGTSGTNAGQTSANSPNAEQPTDGPKEWEKKSAEERKEEIKAREDAVDANRTGDGKKAQELRDKADKHAANAKEFDGKASEKRQQAEFDRAKDEGRKAQEDSANREKQARENEQKDRESLQRRLREQAEAAAREALQALASTRGTGQSSSATGSKNVGVNQGGSKIVKESIKITIKTVAAVTKGEVKGVAKGVGKFNELITVVEFGLNADDVVERSHGDIKKEMTADDNAADTTRGTGGMTSDDINSRVRWDNMVSRLLHMLGMGP